MEPWFRKKMRLCEEVYPYGSAIELTIFKLVDYTMNLMKFDQDIVQDMNARDAMEKGLTRTHIRYFFNSYPERYRLNRDSNGLVDSKDLEGINSNIIKQRTKDCAFLDKLRVLFEEQGEIDRKLLRKRRGWLSTSAA
jgi:hypothetical protein